MLISEAQELTVIDPSGEEDHSMSLIPLEIVDAPSHHHEESHEHGDQDPIEVLIEMTDLPGAPPGTKDPEPIEVQEEIVEDKKDTNSAEAIKSEKWDWSKRGLKEFLPWAYERYKECPEHSGLDTTGIDRAIAYLEKLDSEASKAMRQDFDGEISHNEMERFRAMLENGTNRLQDRLDKIKNSKKKPKKKKTSSEENGLVKEAQKITGVQGIYIMAPLFASMIARTCINGMISAGHSIEDLYDRQVKKWKLSSREQAEVIQLMDDMGYTVKRDRGFMPDEDIDVASNDNMDWAANYNSPSETWGKDR